MMTKSLTAEGNFALLQATIQALFSLYIFTLLFFPRSAEKWNFLLVLAFFTALYLEKLDPSTGDSRKFRNVFVSVLISFAAFNFLSAAFPVDANGMEFSNRNNHHFFGAIISIGLGLGLRTEHAIERMLAVLLGLASVWYFWELVYLSYGSPFKNNRFEGFWSYNANQTAMILLVLFSLYTGSALSARGATSTLLHFAGALLMAFLLFLTKTRFALLTMVFITLPTALFFQRKLLPLRWRISSSVIIFCLVAPLSAFVWWNMADDNRQSFGGFTKRMYIWQTALKINQDSTLVRKIFGSGSIEEIYPVMAGASGADPVYGPNKRHAHPHHPPHAHNVVLQTLIETGVVGAIHLVLIWSLGIVGIMKVWGKRRRTDNCKITVPLITALISMVVISQIDSLLSSTPAMYSWFVLGLSYAYLRVYLAHNVEYEAKSGVSARDHSPT